jgi:hypothetical protein
LNLGYPEIFARVEVEREIAGGHCTPTDVIVQLLAGEWREEARGVGYVPSAEDSLAYCDGA